ncbi:MAG: NADH:flavin oxidoreductase [Hyphomicrobiales bacterium]|nr:NADH:flavin oxidoreductase [Hyphomicrobiales bacterium]MBV9432675.1 NADH:flavin oxidoreductase [Hyphomicrobiales bacterium]
MKFGEFPKLASFGSVAAFRAHLDALGLDMPCDDIVASGATCVFAAPIEVAGMKIGNRLALNPMEGWDGEPDGRPSENTIRRWRRFGASGGKLVWGGEAVAVRPDGRANPNQLVMSASTQAEIARLREALVEAHREAMGSDEGLVIGLQLTHSGRFCKPNDHKKFEPFVAYRHPLLDRKFGYPDDRPVMSDDEIRRLVEDFVIAAKRAQEAGFDFVDIKHCHGYLAHEFLSAHTRPGPYGGSLENRTRFLREVVAGVRSRAPGLGIGVRLSAADLVPFRPDPARSKPGALGPGIPEDFSSLLPYVYAFGAAPHNPTEIDLAEPFALFGILRGLDIRFVNVTLASPYYNPHVTRPALYPPSDGYFPPEDPLVGVMRHLYVVRRLKEAHPDFCLMGSGYTYLQEFLPNVAQAVLRLKWTDFVGLGRMLLAYPELVRDLLEGKPMQKKRLCRSFSDCTTAPRNGLVSGCYPLDAHYKKSEEFKRLAALKKPAKTA